MQIFDDDFFIEFISKSFGIKWSSFSLSPKDYSDVVSLKIGLKKLFKRILPTEGK